MFTGIVEETGRVEDVQETQSGIALRITAGRSAAGLKIGDSIAVNGCCLTVVEIRNDAQLRFDLLRETWDRTNLQFVSPGSHVNLERPLRADGRLDGHFVTGHIDGLGRIVRWERSGADHVLEIAPPAELIRQIVQKGSIAVDGISLTVASVNEKTFTVWIIPHTFEVTALRERKIGDAVNLETDILGKYIEKMLLAK
ncbi:MAG TPA: riboflavin synthase [Verrucomicrobiae bacterium]|nr:riboflavin synthase [Verrucomicrobiae bacterium]